MPSFVFAEKCDGCKGQDKTACMYICPNDLMVLDKEKMKAYNRDPSMCWECQCCVKICPQQAMDVRGYSDFIPLGGFATHDDLNSEALATEPQSLGLDAVPSV
jgi:adenylylsulfate reductase subunit B